MAQPPDWDPNQHPEPDDPAREGSHGVRQPPRERVFHPAAAEARRQLAIMVAGDDADIDLIRAALLVAQEQYPALDAGRYLVYLARLAERLAARCSSVYAAADRLRVLADLLAGEEHFRGNSADYHDPRNSYLNEVIDRRLGLPITLSVVALEVGRQAGLPLRGVGFPGHFLLSYESGNAQDRVFFDLFHGGRILTAAECASLLPFEGGRRSLQAEHVAPSTARHILYRLVNNLKLASVRRGELANAVRASEQLSLILPTTSELRDRGLLRFRMGDLKGAGADLSHYLEIDPNPADGDVIRDHLRLLHELHARRN